MSKIYPLRGLRPGRHHHDGRRCNRIHLREADRFQNQIYEVMLQTDQLLAALTNAETGHRGFFLTGLTGHGFYDHGGMALRMAGVALDQTAINEQSLRTAA